MTLHRLKIWPEFFNAIVIGTKTVELRKDDRNPPYTPGDLVAFEEWTPSEDRQTGQYTGRWHGKKIETVWRGDPTPAGYCMFSLVQPDSAEDLIIKVGHQTTVSS